MYHAIADIGVSNAIATDGCRLIEDIRPQYRRNTLVITIYPLMRLCVIFQHLTVSRTCDFNIYKVIERCCTAATRAAFRIAKGTDTKQRIDVIFRKKIAVGIEIPYRLEIAQCSTATVTCCKSQRVYLILHPVKFTDLFILPQSNIKRRYILVATFLDCQLVDIYATIDLKVFIFEFHQLTSLNGIVFGPVGSVLVTSHEYLINLWQISKAGIVVSGKPYTGLTEQLYTCSVNIVRVLNENISQNKMVASIHQLVITVTYLSTNLIRLVGYRCLTVCCLV